MRSFALLLTFLALTASDVTAGVLRLPLTAYPGGPFIPCLSTGHFRAFAGERGIAFSVALSDLDETDGDGIPCSGDEYTCILSTDFGTVVLRPEIIAGDGRSLRDACLEAGLCPGAGLEVFYAANFLATCYGRGAFSIPTDSMAVTFPAPNQCEALVLGDVPPPAARAVAWTGVNLACP